MRRLLFLICYKLGRWIVVKIWYTKNLYHVINRHFTPGRNAGQFTISVEEFKKLLGRKDVIDTIGTASERSGQYTRIVNIGENIGTIKPSIPNLGGKPTTWITVITDIKGNLITAYPSPAP